MKGADHRAEVRGWGQVGAGQPLKIIPYRWGELSIIRSIQVRIELWWILIIESSKTVRCALSKRGLENERRIIEKTACTSSFQVF